MPYLIPDDLSPDELQCIKVWIPTDPQWSSVFWGAFNQLVHWWNFERDPEHKAAVVAEFWRSLFNMAYEAHSNGETCGSEDDDMSTYRRVHPQFPWIMQETRDDGATWYNILIQPHWDSSSIPNPPLPPEENPADLAASIIRNWYLWILQTLVHKLFDDSESAIGAANYVMAILVPDYIYPDEPDMFNGIETAAEILKDTLSEEDAHSIAEEECNWNAANNYLSDQIATRGPNWIDALNEASDLLGGVLNSMSQDIVDGLNATANAFTKDKWIKWVLGDHGMGGGGAGFGGGNCEYIFSYMGMLNDTVQANMNHPRRCHTLTVDVPEGYALAGLYMIYSVNVDEFPYTSMVLHTDPDCIPLDPVVPLWGPTSYSLDPAHHLALAVCGNSTYAFTGNDFDISDAMEPYFYINKSFEDLTGPKTFSAAFHWRARLTEQVTGTVAITAIMVKTESDPIF